VGQESVYGYFVGCIQNRGIAVPGFQGSEGELQAGEAFQIGSFKIE
jgi:hypothetical protein